LAKLNFYFDLSKNFLYYDNIKPTALGHYQLICYFFTVDENENKKIRWEILAENILSEIFGNFQIFAKKKNFSTTPKNLPTKKSHSKSLKISQSISLSLSLNLPISLPVCGKKHHTPKPKIIEIR